MYRYKYALPPEIFDTHPLQILRFVCKDRGEIYIGIYTYIYTPSRDLRYTPSLMFIETQLQRLTGMINLLQ